ncbi:MAG: lipopolysaccharide biosynthesis protein [Proteobacteria bacterium]|nr:lipopolysaccharide biosynthesis protein [Pseudomonadota bacterium]
MSRAARAQGAALPARRQPGAARLLLGGLVALLTAASTQRAGAAPTATTAIAIVGEATASAQALRERLLLDRGFVAAPLERARVIWAIGDLQPALQRLVLARVRDGGAGLVVVPGRAPAAWLRALGLTLRGTARGPVAAQATSLAPPALAGDVVWASAPQLGARYRLGAAAGGGSAAQVLVETAAAHAGGRDPVLLSAGLGHGRLYVWSARLTDASNRELLLWPYAGYLLYWVSSAAAAQPPQRFADWSRAPVPGRSNLTLLLLLLGAGWVVTWALFARARAYSRAHPELAETFFAHERAASGGAAAGGGASSADAWSRIGFARPLAGFLTLTSILLLLFVPYYWLTNLLIPNRVQPFPQAKGIWDFSWEALQVAWFLFDAGTFTAFVKYFAEYRSKDPARALRSAQFFVWWQVLSGLVFVTLASLAALLILPHTRYSYSAHFVVLIALIQYPGIFGLLTVFFQAYQRFDLNVGLDLLSDWLLRFALQIPCVLLLRAWGRSHPQYGEAFGAALGIGVGFYLSMIVTFVIGVPLYRRQGLRLLPLFLVHFDRGTAKQLLSYGLRVVSGQVFYRAAKTIERVVISLLLINYTEWLGLESQIHYNLMFLFPIAYRFFETAMAALSESHGNGKHTLTQYYLARFLQMGGLYAAVGASLLWALGPAFVRQAMDPQWARAAEYLTLAALVGVFFAPAWLSDMLQKGAGRPGLFALMLGGEQALRIGLFWVLIPKLQFTGFYVALLATIVLKVVVGWTINHRSIVRLRFFAWQMAVAPLLTGAANYALWRLVAAALPPLGAVGFTIFFFGAALLSFPICFFALGLCGGFDRYLADELAQAWRMTGALRPVARLLYAAAHAGFSLSPLHDRFPITLAPQAAAEAQSLEHRALEGRNHGSS